MAETAIICISTIAAALGGINIGANHRRAIGRWFWRLFGCRCTRLLSDQFSPMERYYICKYLTIASEGSAEHIMSRHEFDTHWEQLIVPLNSCWLTNPLDGNVITLCPITDGPDLIGFEVWTYGYCYAEETAYKAMLDLLNRILTNQVPDINLLDSVPQCQIIPKGEFELSDLLPHSF